MQTAINLTIARNSNGSVDLVPSVGDGSVGVIEKIVVYVNGTPSSKLFPAAGRMILSLDQSPLPPDATPVPAVELPTLAVLPDVLVALTTAEQVESLQAQDERKGAAALYEARLAELRGA